KHEDASNTRVNNKIKEQISAQDKLTETIFEKEKKELKRCLEFLIIL
ncbi:14670_t:CDS:1, partial [Gigaspora margarita]